MEKCAGKSLKCENGKWNSKTLHMEHINLSADLTTTYSVDKLIEY